MPVPQKLNKDLKLASDCNTKSTTNPLREKIGVKERKNLELDPSLDGVSSVVFINPSDSSPPTPSSCSDANLHTNSSNNLTTPTKCVVGHGNGAIMVYERAFDSDETGSMSCLKMGSTAGLPMIKVIQNPSEPNIVYAACVDGYIYVCNHAKQTPTSVLVKENGNEPMALCLIENNSMLVTAGKDTHVRLYDTKTAQVSRAYHGSKVDTTSNNGSRGVACRPSQKVFCLKTSPSNSHCFFSAGWDNSIKIWDSRTSEGVVHSITHHKYPPHVCGDALDVRICGGIGVETILTASWRNHKSLQLWDANSLKLIKTLKFPSTKDDGEYLYACRFVNDSVVVAGGSGTKDAVFINFHTGKPMASVGDCSKPMSVVEADERSGLTLVGGASYNKLHVVQVY